MLSSPKSNKHQHTKSSFVESFQQANDTFSLMCSQPFSSLKTSPTGLPQEISFGTSSKPMSNSIPLRESCLDRFIPVRSDPAKRKLLFDIHEEAKLSPKDDSFSTKTQQNDRYRLLLEEQVLGLQRNHFQENYPSGASHQGASLDRILSFKNTNKADSKILQQSCFPFTCENININHVKKTRKVPDKPCRVLEAPFLEDDYYLNLLDWSSSNIVAVALKDTVYLWSGANGEINRLNQMDTYSDLYTSVGWDPTGNWLATGISNGKIEIWDPYRMKVVRDDLEGHNGRIGCLSWSNSNILASGSMDNSILLRDMRIRGPQSTVMTLKGHKYEVCGLKWSPNSMQLASGGNDNKLFIWNVRKGSAEAKFGDHKAAVKALAWSPHQNGLLVSGGGNNDKTIKFWNTLTMKNVKSIDTASQVCNLMFSKNSNEFVSTHGFNNNHVIIWKYPELSKVSVLEGHTSRVLYLGLSPNGETLVTGAGAMDETLRFWNAFPPLLQNRSSKLMPSSTNLR